MIRKEREITDPAEMREIILSAIVCRLAMCDGDKPYLVPLCFALDGDMLYFHCARQGMKLDILRRNPNVCFEFEGSGMELIPKDTACSTSIKYRSVIGFGKASMVDDPEEARRGLDAIVRQYGGGSTDYSEKMLEKTLVFRVDIESMTGRRS